MQAAQQAAELSADPVAAKLAIWLRAQTPGAASASEIDRFLRANPDWPGRALLNHNLQQALAVEPDDAVARSLCLSHRPAITPALLRCAVAVSAPPSGADLLPPPAGPDAPGRGGLAPLPPAIQAAAVAAWVGGMDDTTEEAEFLRLFGTVPGPADQWRRFDRQEWSGSLAAARRQLPRLAASDQKLAQVRLALHAGDADADRLAGRLVGPAAGDPTLLLDLARWLRRHDRQDAALALWRGRAGAAEPRVASSARRAAFWAERAALARDLLDAQRNQDALFLARDAAQEGAQADASTRLDAAFLGGWIALRRLHDPAAAIAPFTELTRTSHSVITTSRGWYWLGEALSARGDAAAGRLAFEAAARRPTSFYGQAAIRRLTPDDPHAARRAIEVARDPAWTEAEAIRFAGLELAHAATLLVAWNDPRQARAFLLRLDELADTGRDHALGAALANRLGLPDVAVAIARNAGRQGLVLAQEGWPAPYAPPGQPALPAGLALAVMRQESSFDTQIISPAGAHGLMQLMPATARALSAAAIDNASLADPQQNMALGTRYLADLLRQFGGSVPCAVAAYNAGPTRVRQWLQQHEAASDPDGLIDWIELIPFAETRNYVQRVLENKAIYALREVPPVPSQVARVSSPQGATP